MPDNRLLSQIQHAIQYPSGHLDRFAQFGPTFEDGTPTQAPAPPADMDTKYPPAKLAETARKRFILGGKALFTIQGVHTRYTYRITLSEAKVDSKYPPAYFISLLTGSNNLEDYTYLGVLNPDSGAVRLTRASRYTVDSQPVKALNWCLARVWRGADIAPAEFWHVGRCGRCGRALTVPSSIESGFGPECLGKLGE